MPARQSVLGVGLLAALVACGPPEPPSGPWHAWLDSPGGELPFGLELERGDAGPRAFLINGEERAEVADVVLDGDGLRIRIEPYDAEIVATLDRSGRRLDGRWSKTVGPGRRSSLGFHAVAGSRPRFSPPRRADPDGIAGRWEVHFESDASPAVGQFSARPDGTVRGTFLTATGDYRFLAGTFGDDRLRLSTFDGAHAFLFDARLLDDGTLAGDFWSRDAWHETWTARRDARAELPDAFGLTSWNLGAELDRVAFPDLDGRPRSLASPEFAGRARILEIFGTWCPNCNDAARTLDDLYDRYGDHGLSILGLAFEVTGDPARDAAQVRRWIEHHGIRYPVLLAGVADKERASDALPLLDRVRSYPTTVFLDAHGRVRAVHQGFSGPATGEAHERLVSRFRELVETMLEEAPASE